MSKPAERCETGEGDLIRCRLDQIIDMKHELVQLAQATAWSFLEERFGEVYSDGPGMPRLPDPADGRAGNPQTYVQPVR